MALLQNSTLPPAQPAYVFRGHNAQIHSICFVRHNTRLLTGDAEGWLILWNLASKRPVAVWRGHAAAILAVSTWTDDKLITHGRDSKLRVWQLRESDESTFSVVLPIEDPVTLRHEPWLLHTISVNTLNFCSFSSCEASPSEAAQLSSEANETTLLVAVPGDREGDIDIYSLPSKMKLSTVCAPKTVKLGMAMCVKISIQGPQIILIAGYESGHCCFWQFDKDSSKWILLSTSKSHSQPVLSLDIAHSLKRYYTSAADATIASHSLTEPTTSQPLKTIETKHSGQQSLRVRSDDKILATAGWDGNVRVYSVKTMRELAVLKWHKQGCYALAFADLLPEQVEDSETNSTGSSEGTEALQTAVQRRNTKAQTTHWIAAGSKDGKVSLWDIY
ncbi:WD40 repeat-like protein [Aureobasidium pullulans]|uniref:ASTRA-associated protein 1 n=2 Tax=Aureobasidium pullulans TaxID=5580 RepID=A0A4S8YAS7_AURPU|nr:WD40 repeat-like protein [Aureobasidium pullulans]THW47815.1 WD40 repeat-like protein [Aureobasidium pullulans]THX85491.1 WD40 repeat-like protein [Aureobasidium pullulans]THY58243.1 WD40 repeat-like protein [Aureobasidium pullulans]THY73026.1 WD40 repeat-like protein [Aureobasidium pullulans]